MTIKVYSSIMPSEPEEVYEMSGITVEQWVKRLAGEDYEPGECQPVSCSINGAIIDPLDWHRVFIGERDAVEFRVTPRGDVLNFAFPFWAGSFAASKAAINLFTPDIPGQQGRGNQGQNLSAADAKANTARLGEGVPECLGFYIRYPDYLNQPRRFYQDTKTQVLRLMLSVGVGSYQVESSNVKIGETPIDELQNAEFRIYEPDADLSGEPNNENWFPSPEVGSTGSSTGIRLRGPTYDERTYSGSAIASDDTLSSIDVGDLWTSGNTGFIKMTQSITVNDGGGADTDPDVFVGNFQHLAQGINVNIESNAGVNGTYVVSTINAEKTEITLETTGGSPVADADTGSRIMSIDKEGTEYSLLSTDGASQIDVERILSGGFSDPDWDGNLPQTSLTVEIKWHAATFVATRSGPFVACPSGETTDTVEVDIFAPQGLGVVDDESINARSRTIRIEWRAVGDSSWQEQTHQVSGNTRDQLGWTFPINLPSSIKPEVRVSRIGGEDVSVTSLDRLEFTGLRSRLPTVNSYPGVTTMAVDIIGSDEISSQSNNRINLEVLRKLEPVAGGAATGTRSISRAAAYVARTLGYGTDDIDAKELERLDDLWASRGDYFDYVFSSGTAKDAIDTILRAGFAAMTLDNGVITPVRDEPRTQFEQGYSPANMRGPLQRTFTGKQPDEADGVEVEFTKAGTWTKETVKCLLPGDQGVKLDKIKLDGVTDETRAWRIGMRRRRVQEYRRWTYNFQTELDALNSSYLSYVPLIDDIPGYGKASIMQAIASHAGGALVTVSEPMEWIDGESHVVAYRDEYGDLVGPFPATRGDTDYQIIAAIPEPWPDLTARQEPPHVYFGTSAKWTFPALIQDITPGGTNQVSAQATNYDERVYADDSNSPP